ncbi:DNA-3-methyladenine glycosylase I [Algivirga pacifica]|uniref:DNA-3-methyladenine glycosylase I n=1 Tax=Algivirga pacifica TaxID=1162670 RepID=A0ABP9CZI7_9BACT
MENTYCLFVSTKGPEDLHRKYHDTAYGFPIDDDNELFGRLILEINQAGLSWDLILKKEENFRKAYADFDIEKVANFTEEDRERLLTDAGIIRNKLKVNAAIHNAQRIQELQQEYGSFKAWLDTHHPKTKEEWVKLFKKTFKFTGGEITNEFLMSTGYLPGAHHPDCPIYQEVLAHQPAFISEQ